MLITYSNELNWGQCYKTCSVRNLRIFAISQSVSSWQAFPASIMFVDNSGAYLSGSSFQVLSSRVGSRPYPQKSIQAGKLARDKHSSLLRKCVNYGWEKFDKTTRFIIINYVLKSLCFKSQRVNFIKLLFSIFTLWKNKLQCWSQQDVLANSNIFSESTSLSKK